MTLILCPNCHHHRFIDSPCGHCGAQETTHVQSTIQKSAMAVLLGLSALSVACAEPQSMYGVPMVDNDEDGFYEYDDCDDNNPDINPSAEDEEGDGIDQKTNDGVDGIAEDDTGDDQW